MNLKGTKSAIAIKRPGRRRLYQWVFLSGLLIFPQLGTGKAFEDVTEEAGVSYIQMDPGFTPPIEGGLDQYQSGGAAAGDYDNDGWVDLLVTRVGASDILFRNLGADRNGDVRFENVSESAGFTEVYDSNGVAWADFDGDGDLDVYIITMYHDRNYLYFNNGDGTFSKAPNNRGAGLIDTLIDKKGTSVAVGDYDKDGWIDIHTTEWFINTTDEGSEKHNVLLKNLGPNAPAFFRNETLRAGTEINRGDVQLVPHGFAFASNFADLDNDGWPDLAVTGDFVSSQMFWNNGDGTFIEKTEEAGLGLANNAMGSTIADYDQDGDLDWFVTSRYDNRLYQNQGNRQFVDVGRDLGIDDSGWGWAASWIDYDNDGDLDLAVTNGYNDYSGNTPDIDPTYFYVNEGGSFRNAATELGITDNDYGKALLTFDYDNDGDLDLFITNSQSTPVLYRNVIGEVNNWLQVSLRGRSSNSQGLQSKVYLKRKKSSPPAYQELIGGNNFLSQNEMILHYGLGNEIDSVYSLEIRWPSGITQTLESIPINQEIFVFESADQSRWLDEHFSTEEKKEPSISGDSADPDNDGLSNLFEYAFGSLPRTYTLTPPSIEVSRDQDSSQQIRFKYEQSSGRTDLSYDYEISTDLKTWVQVEKDKLTTRTLNYKTDGKETVEVILQNPTHGTRQFVRIRATRNSLLTN